MGVCDCCVCCSSFTFIFSERILTCIFSISEAGLKISNHTCVQLHVHSVQHA